MLAQLVKDGGLSLDLAPPLPSAPADWSRAFLLISLVRARALMLRLYF
jgi:hypothetical protein